MRADRLLSEILLLQAHGRMSGREIAQKLEISERTLHRDMEALSAAGVPIFALRGAQGGWQLDENWRTQVPALDDAELRALLMSQARFAGDERMASAAERAFNKLVAALPAGLREKAASIRQRLHVDTTGWRGTSENLAMLPIVQDAVARDKKLSIRYHPTEGEHGERVVDPLGLVAKGSTWYLVAHTPRGMRTYRVSRIDEARILDAKCHRPPGFDLATHWASATKQFREKWSTFHVLLRLEASAAAEMKMWRIATHVQEDHGAPENWTTVRVSFDSEGEARFVVLGFGGRAQVLEPDDFRARIVREAGAIVARNRAQ